MKKRWKILFLILIFLTIPSNCFASDTSETTDSTKEVLQSQQDSLNITNFIEEAQKYTEDTFEDIDLNDVFSAAITGNIDNATIMKSILNILGKEIVSCITVLGSIIVIVIVHSILKSISEGLENKSISQITYYVQYILIVTLIMSNFADIIDMVRTSINNLVGFMNSLVPLLLTLMLTTGNIASVRFIRTNYFIYYYFYRKLYKCYINSICTYFNCSQYCFKSF